MKNKVIYEEYLGKIIDVYCNSKRSIGYLKEIRGLDHLILNPSLINYSTVLEDRSKIQSNDTVVYIPTIQTFNTVDEGYMEEMVNAQEEKNRNKKLKKRPAKDLNKPKKDI